MGNFWWQKRSLAEGAQLGILASKCTTCAASAIGLISNYRGPLGWNPIRTSNALRADPLVDESSRGVVSLVRCWKKEMQMTQIATLRKEGGS